jgi:hypothetical protein
LRDDAPAGVDQVSWNGKPVAVHRNADGNLTAGGTSRHDGIGFTWPSAAAGSNDNVAADGPAITVSGSGNTLAFTRARRAAGARSSTPTGAPRGSASHWTVSGSHPPETKPRRT